MPLLAVIVSVLVYAPPSGKAGAKLADAAQAMRQALRSKGHEVVEGAIDKARAERARGWVADRTLAFFAEGRAQLEEGRRALERVELAQAEAAFARAEKIYGDRLDRPGAAELMSLAARERGVAAWLGGRTADARVAFRRALVLDPAAQLTEATVRPDVAKAFAEVAAQLRTATKAAVSLEVEPAGAQLHVDGKPAGTQLELDAGEHLVRATLDGKLPWARLVMVKAGTPIKIVLADDPDEAALSALKSRPAQEGAAVLEASLGLDAVVAAAVALDAGKLVFVGQRHTRAGCHTEVLERKSAGELIDALLKASEACEPDPSLDGRQVVEARTIAHPRPEPIVTPPPLPPRKKKIWERPWLWLGVFAAGTLAVGLGAGLAPRDSKFAANVEANSFSH